MNLTECLEVLEIPKDELKSLDLIKLKSIYKKLVLKHHPDKGGDVSNFHRLIEAYNNMTSILLNKLQTSPGKYENIQKYMDYFYDVMKNKCDLNKEIIQLISKLVNDFLLHLQSNKDSYLELLKLININLRSNIEENTPISCITLKPSIDDILYNNIFRLVYKDNTYFVPLWHKEVIFEDENVDFMVVMDPQLPENVYIKDNVIHIILYENTNELLQCGKCVFYIGSKEYIMDANKLLLKKYQMQVLKKQGISKINSEDVYDIDKKDDIVVHLNLC